MSLLSNTVALEKLVEDFVKKGGKINKCYLSNLTRNRHSLVYMKGWYGGVNLRTAITKALSNQ